MTENLRDKIARALRERDVSRDTTPEWRDTDDARAEAERRWPLWEHLRNSWDARAMQAAFIRGAAWARDRAAHTVTAEQVDAAARALWDRRRDHHDDPEWGGPELHARFEQAYRDEIHAAFRAAGFTVEGDEQ